MILDNPNKATLIKNNTIKEYLLIGNWGQPGSDYEMRDTWELFPVEVDEMGVWSDKYQELNPYHVAELVCLWYFHFSNGNRDKAIQSWGNEFVEKAAENTHLIIDYYKKYFEADLPELNYELFFDPFWGLDADLIKDDNNTWCRIGTEYVVLFDECVEENPKFIMADFYDQFIEDTQELGDKLFL